MLGKLRLKFIVLNMVIVAVVLAVAFSSICLFSRQQETAAVQAAFDASLAMVGDARDMRDRDAFDRLENSDSFEADGAANPEGKSGQGEGAADAADAQSGFSQGDPGGQDVAPVTQQGEGEAGMLGDEGELEEIAPPEIGGRKDSFSFDPMIPVATYRVTADGGLATIASSTTATITSDVLAEATQLLATVDDGFGEFESLGLLYEKRTIGNATYVAFADSAEASSWKSLALALLGVGILALGIFFIISLFFSKWALRPVKKAWETQTRFVADASHDLKTPLTIILANTSIMKKHPDATVDEMGQWLESTECEARDMQVLVEDMLVLARLDEAASDRHGSAESANKQQQVNLSKIAEAEVLQFESIAFEDGLALSDDIEEGIELAGDEARLKRLMSTLIDNACKYAGRGGNVKVSLRCSADGRQAIFSVHNTGSVIAEEDLPYVFDRFYRSDKSRALSASQEADAMDGRGGAGRGDASASPSRKSHGLGLAIARGIAEEHQGELSVESTEEDGTRFTVRLPMQK